MNHRITKQLTYSHCRCIIWLVPEGSWIHLKVVVTSNIASRWIFCSDHAAIQMLLAVCIIQKLSALSPSTYIIVAYYINFIHKCIASRIWFCRDLIMGKSHLSGRVNSMAVAAQFNCKLLASHYDLLWNLISDAPKHDARMITVTIQHCL